jgi:hypothetical protein
MYFFIKCLVSGVLIALISEVAKKFTFFGACIASLPLTSILAFIWLYFDTKDTSKIIELSYEIFFLVIPSLVFFIALPLLLNYGLKFYVSLLLSCIITALAYGVFIYFKSLFLN